MSDNQNAPADNASLEDIQSRKTQKFTLSDPLQPRITNTGKLNILSDTQTRRTIKLKPVSPAQPGAAATTGGTFSATATQRTVVLKPGGANPATAAAAAASRPVPVMPSLKPKIASAMAVETVSVPKMTPTPVAVPDPADETVAVPKMSPKPVMPTLKPTAGAMRPQPPQMANPLDTVSSDVDSETIAVTKITPAEQPVADADVETVAVPKMSPNPAMPAMDGVSFSKKPSDETIKIKRPDHSGPATPAARATAAAAGQKIVLTPPKSQAAADPEAAKATIVLSAGDSAVSDATAKVPKINAPTPVTPGPKLNMSIPKPAAAAAPAIPAMPPLKMGKKQEESAPAEKPAEAPPAAEPKKGGLLLKKEKVEAPPEAKAAAAAETEEEDWMKLAQEAAMRKAANQGGSGKLYFAYALATLLLLAFASTLIIIQYLNTYQRTRIGGKTIDLPIVGKLIKR